MKKQLEIGTLDSGVKFSLPLDFVLHTLAIIAIRGWGKTVAATVIAEEMCEAGLPWVAIDPVGVWWGLRVNPDGSPGGYPIVVIGGEHADIPLDKDAGSRMAEAILEENICCVVDLRLESKNTWRKFVTDFSERLMELRPAVPRHIFLEEAPEFVPQRPMGEQRRTLGAVERLARLGRNNGYGLTLISQRFATVHKDVLTQGCESLLAGRSIGKHDREAARDWIAEVVGGTESEKKAEKFMESLTQLDNGVGWFWSPQWLDLFSKVRIRHRKTYHPGETRTLGVAPKQVALSDVREFVDRLRKTIEKKPLKSPKREPVAFASDRQPTFVPPSQQEVAMREESAQLRAQVADLHRKFGAAEAALNAVRQVMEPQYRALQKLFSELDAVVSSGGDSSAYEPWKAKLGAGPAKLIDILVSRGECTRVQLQTLSGYSSRSMSNHISRLNSNQLIEKNGDKIHLRPI